MTPALEARGLTKRYEADGETVTAVDGIDLDVAAGELVAVVGPSGCGKSTLLHLLGGLARPTAGEVRIAGRVLADMDDDQLAEVRRDRVGFVFQAYNLVPVLTVIENVALPARLAGHDARTAAAAAEAKLAAVGLSAKANRRPSQLSGGEQQRAAIARALVLEPDILLADEPTGNLDTATGTAVVDLLAQLNAQGQTTVIVTHDTKVASRTRRVLFMRDGRFVRETALERPADALLLARLIDGDL